MRIIPVLAVAALSLGLGACSQTLGTAAGAGVGAMAGAAAGSYFFRPEPQIQHHTRTVVVEQPTYARPMYQGPTTISRTYITRQGY